MQDRQETQREVKFKGVLIQRRELDSQRNHSQASVERGFFPCLVLARKGANATRSAISHQPTYTPASASEMKLPKFLRPPKSRRQNRTEARSEISPVDGQGQVDSAVPRSTGSTPDLRIGTSALPMPSSLTPRDQGMYCTADAVLKHSSERLVAEQTLTPIPTKLYVFLNVNKATSQMPRAAPSIQARYPWANPTGSRPRVLPQS